VGDPLVVGTISGRVRAMLNDRGEPVEEAPPSMPVLVMGLSEVPNAGDVFEVVDSEREARAIAEERQEEERLSRGRPSVPQAVSLDEIFSQYHAGKVQELNVVFKADVQGSVEPIVNSLEKLCTDDLRVRIIHQGIGAITEWDVMLAATSQAIVIGFNVDVDEAAARVAQSDGVDIRRYDIIYRVVEDVDKALKGMLEPEYEDVVIGHAEVRAVFRIRRRGNVAGSYVTDGEVRRNARARVMRGGEDLFDGSLDSLKRFQEDVSEVKAGFECGISVEGFGDFAEGDILEFYVKERVS
jgi:translation initiation factor IF-2